ncbi:MAG: DNA methyltransferase [Armatimonadota bacterium]
MSKRQPKNDVNDLTGTEWIKFTRTWFVCDSPRYYRNKDTELHPARYPEEMVAEFVRFFTKREGWVLDPFAGSGASLIACAEEGRHGVGVELSAKYAEVIRRRTAALTPPQTVMGGDARVLATPACWQEAREALSVTGLPFVDELPVFDFSISSPPYGDMLRKGRGGVYSKHRQRGDQGLDTVYSDDPHDLGTIPDHGRFVTEVAAVYRGVARLLKPDGYLVIVIQNYRDAGGEVIPLAWDLAKELSQDLLFQGERIWCQNTKPLGIWGYPKTFVPNYHHHYCLIFRNRKPPVTGVE